MKFKIANILLPSRYLFKWSAGCCHLTSSLHNVKLPDRLALLYNPIISAEPVFIVRPSSQRVGLNGIAKFDCVAQGNPPPSVFWAKEVKIRLYLISVKLELVLLQFYTWISNMIVNMSKWPNDTSVKVYSWVVGSVKVSYSASANTNNIQCVL